VISGHGIEDNGRRKLRKQRRHRLPFPSLPRAYISPLPVLPSNDCRYGDEKVKPTATVKTRQATNRSGWREKNRSQLPSPFFPRLSSQAGRRRVRSSDDEGRLSSPQGVGQLLVLPQDSLFFSLHSSLRWESTPETIGSDQSNWRL
jgi:hypothetical protein